MKWESAPPFEFEINGKTYSVPPIGERDYVEYLNWSAIVAGRKEAPAPEDEGALLLLDAYEQMLADKVPAGAIRRAMLTVFTDLNLDRETAEKVWESGLTPEALAPKGAEQDSTQSSSTGVENATQKQASSTGTTSPRATKRAAKAKKSAS